MSTVNKVILVGYLGQDPEMQKSEKTNDRGENTQWLDNSVATKRFAGKGKGDKDRDGNATDYATEWTNFKVYGQTADFLSKNAKKGSLIYLEGDLRTDSWEKEGVKHYKTYVRVRDASILAGWANEKGSGTPDNATSETKTATTVGGPSKFKLPF